MNHYPIYPDRTILDLAGFWEFHWLGDADWATIGPVSFVPDTVMPVPGVIDSLPAYTQKRGVGIYRKQLPDDFRPGERLRLKIGGLGLFARLWFDGKHLGDCQLPYSGVHYDFAVECVGRHELVIAIDNRFDPERVPLFNPNYDFYGYGGIYREVELHRLPDCAIDRVQVTPLDLATVRLTIKLHGQVPAEVAFAVAFDGGAAQSFTLPVAHGQARLELPVPNPRVWSPENPQLHIVEVAMAGDRIRERFGLRTIAASGQRILLNGQPVELRGFNRHEAHPQLGPVQPASLMVEDIQWLRQMNGNFLRCVHYPQNEAFFDLCDELGILVWTESMGWGNKPEQLGEPRFAELQEEQTRLLVRNGCNHPSIIIWAFLNEAASDSPDAVPLYSRLVDAIRQEDSSRLVSYASNRCTRDRCFGLVDLISLNTYPGWIGNPDWTIPSIDRIAPHIDSLMEFFSQPEFVGKPLMFSEIGACGLYGCHDLARSQWTEEYQADYMVQAAKTVLGHPRTCGLALWQFCDSRSYGPVGDVRCKPRGYNNAGVIDEYRRPKIAALELAKLFATLCQD